MGFQSNSDSDNGLPTPRRETIAKAPARGSPDSSSLGSVRAQRATVLGQIYYDLNRIGKVRKRVREKTSSASERKLYWQECRKAADFIGQAVNMMQELDHGGFHTADGLTASSELDDLVQWTGWEGLAIAAYSEAFRRILYRNDDVNSSSVRAAVLTSLKYHTNSLEFYGRVRNIDWRGLLLPYSNDNVRYMEDALQIVGKFWALHPHERVVHPRRAGVRRPHYRNWRQHNIFKNFFDPADWFRASKFYGGDYYPVNHTLRTESRYDLGSCDFCGSPSVCRCRLQSMPGELMELFETENRGIGVRALWPFRKGDILGEYLGRLLPYNSPEDNTYALDWQSHDPASHRVVTIDASIMGNWTRFINHSCDASTAFGSRTFGNRAAMTIEAERDIDMFEELTVNYGRLYWRDKECLCGAPNCYSKSEIKQREIESERVDEPTETNKEARISDQTHYYSMEIEDEPNEKNDGAGKDPTMMEEDDCTDHNYLPEDDTSDEDEDDMNPMEVQASELTELSG
ncbi:SET domain protein [Aspergillus saccharolyticus JOP 1030-1]|uniref:SET domain-containing protein n=1 Tax=Aspergillus saccharolyticus JOP 1030-1 TaxID=1450539 RepID=A0A318ZXT7_9EURO|nr:SET domain-containing protein [Aspergillus saccharolyticus JOP 1030-1]PYH48980.1 SET domain-containing protein [Aspergillus saccharolyticus JOP 1030-1]